MSISVVYWSGTGNTEAMANALAEGIREAGGEAVLQTADSVNAAELAKEDIFALGCPSMGAEELEESVMEPFVSELEGMVQGKKILLFGSYGWGDGEWMRNWEETCASDGAVLACDSVICNETPDDAAVAECNALGAALA